MSSSSSKKRGLETASEQLKAKEVKKEVLWERTGEALALLKKEMELTEELKRTRERLEEIGKTWPEVKSLRGTVKKMSSRTYFKVSHPSGQYELVEAKDEESAIEKVKKVVEAEVKNEEGQRKKKAVKEGGGDTRPVDPSSRTSIHEFLPGKEPI